jgi:lysyl-tRNA synthetase class 2
MSALVKTIAYNAEAAELTVHLTNGKAYKFKDVPPLVHRNFIRAESKGSFFNLFIRDSYDFERL